MPRRQVAPIAWLQEPNQRDRVSLLGFTRGTFTGLSIDEAGQFQHVHVSGMRRAFEKLGAPDLYKVGLKLAQLLGEIETTFGGYWAPAPYRVIELGDQSAFIGVASDADPILGEFRNEGLCRLVGGDWRRDVSRQTLDSWMGVPPRNSLTTIAEFKASHSRDELPASDLAGVTYLKLIINRGGSHATSTWSHKPVAVLPAEGIAICRQQLRGRERYFSARLRSGRIATEAPLSIPMSVLRYAIHSHAGKPITAFVRTSDAGTELTITESLPVAEFRLALLVSREIRRCGRSTTFIVSPSLASTISTKLELLGCSLEIMQ